MPLVAKIVATLAEDDGVLLANVLGAMRRTGRHHSLALPDGEQQLTRSAAEIRMLDHNHPSAKPDLDLILKDLAQSILAWREQGMTVLVHCVRAEHRKVAAAYLAEHFGIRAIKS